MGGVPTGGQRSLIELIDIDVSCVPQLLSDLLSQHSNDKWMNKTFRAHAFLYEHPLKAQRQFIYNSAQSFPWY